MITLILLLLMLKSADKSEMIFCSVAAEAPLADDGHALDGRHPFADDDRLRIAVCCGENVFACFFVAKQRPAFAVGV